MQYALRNGCRFEASPGAKGICETCGSNMVAKCGPRVIHHWAHANRKNCDPWWENETQWHREWKNRFPPECREICHVEPGGEVHRADIKTPSGIVVEVQHSTMTDAERLSREAFYPNLIWVLDGTPFRDNFDVYHQLPDPRAEVAQDLVWYKAERHMNGANAGMFLRWSEYRVEHPLATKDKVRSGIIHDMREVAERVIEAYRGHHQYHWVKPRQAWLESSCPVFIDFGGDRMLKLEIYDETQLPCVRVVLKTHFVESVMTESDARSVLRLPA